MAVAKNPWVKFLRNYGPIPTNDNMYDETIQRALHRRNIQPLKLPAQFLEDLLANLQSPTPISEILTGTAGDGKTYHCREAWIRLGGSEQDWLQGHKIQRLKLNGRELVVVKDLSELRAEESADLLKRMALDVAEAQSPRVYLIAANHGQLLDKLKLASAADEVARMARVVEELLVTGKNPDSAIRLHLKDLSRAPATTILGSALSWTDALGGDRTEAIPSSPELECSPSAAGAARRELPVCAIPHVWPAPNRQPDVRSRSSKPSWRASMFSDVATSMLALPRPRAILRRELW
jgi:hypothetical protein